MRYEAEDDGQELKKQIYSSNEKKKFNGFKDFLRWFFFIDVKDKSNYIALLVALFLLWWGIKTITAALSG